MFGLSILEFTSLCDDIDELNCFGWPLNGTIYLYGNSSIQFN